MKLAAALFGILMLADPRPMGADERITIKVSPSVSFAPANLLVRATIRGDADNRAVQVVAESADFYRSSELQLEGERAPRTTTFEFRSLPSGTYQVIANLMGADGRSRAIMRQQVNVMAGGAEER